jgi:hypothetical protein
MTHQGRGVVLSSIFPPIHPVEAATLRPGLVSPLTGDWFLDRLRNGLRFTAQFRGCLRHGQSSWLSAFVDPLALGAGLDQSAWRRATSA